MNAAKELARQLDERILGWATTRPSHAYRSRGLDVAFWGTALCFTSPVLMVLVLGPIALLAIWLGYDVSAEVRAVSFFAATLWALSAPGVLLVSYLSNQPDHAGNLRSLMKACGGIVRARKLDMPSRTLRRLVQRFGYERHGGFVIDPENLREPIDATVASVERIVRRAGELDLRRVRELQQDLPRAYALALLVGDGTVVRTERGGAALRRPAYRG